MTPDLAGKEDIKIESEGITFVLNKRDHEFLKNQNGVLIDENGFWGGLVIRSLNGRSTC